MAKDSDVVEEAKAAINAVFSDTSVDPSVTRERLEELIDEIHTMIDALDADAKRQERDDD